METSNTVPTIPIMERQTYFKQATTNMAEEQASGPTKKWRGSWHQTLSTLTICELMGFDTVQAILIWPISKQLFFEEIVIKIKLYLF